MHLIQEVAGRHEFYGTDHEKYVNLTLRVTLESRPQNKGIPMKKITDLKLVARISVVAVAFSALPGCATITRGSSEAFVVESTPSGADVRLSSGEVCKTPCTLKKKRKDNFVVFIKRDGYEPA